MGRKSLGLRIGLVLENLSLRGERGNTLPPPLFCVLSTCITSFAFKCFLELDVWKPGTTVVYRMGDIHIHTVVTLCWL